MTILLLATGGTIASQPRPSDGAVTTALKGADLLATIPGAEVDDAEVDDAEVDDVEVVDIAHGPSWNFEPAFQAELAAQVREALESGQAGGVVVTHGTDTIAETAWLTELLASRASMRGPIVFTGAMRHAAEVGADGPRNLADALVVARSPEARGRGVLLCAGGQLHHARWVTKTDTTSVATFRSPSGGPLGRVVGRRPVFSLAAPAPPPDPPNGAVVDAVAVVFSHGGIDGAVVDWHLERGARGLVVEATGAGNVAAPLLPGIERALGAGIPVVVASRCATGPVAPIYG
ncbi:MAG: asparaginase, partial [Acidimicrobiales bacterium]